MQPWRSSSKPFNFRDGKPEAEKGEVTCAGSHSQGRAESNPASDETCVKTHTTGRKGPGGRAHGCALRSPLCLHVLSEAAQMPGHHFALAVLHTHFSILYVDRGLWISELTQPKDSTCLFTSLNVFYMWTIHSQNWRDAIKVRCIGVKIKLVHI